MLGKEHPSIVLMSMNNLAIVLSDQGKYEQAEEMHRQALGLSETVLGKEHPDTLTSMNNLATMLRDQGKYEQTEEVHTTCFSRVSNHWRDLRVRCCVQASTARIFAGSEGYRSSRQVE